MAAESVGSPAESAGSLGEDRLVASVLARVTGADAPAGVGLVVGPGDDAAVLAPPVGGLVLSTDTLVEGQDFRTAWSSGADVGAKAAAQNFADIAAMGARPVALLVSLSMPGGTPAGWVEDLSAGVAAECARAGAALVGGDVSAASEVVVTGTAVGATDGVAPVLRSGARVGDVVALCGETGPAAAGLALLETGTTHSEEFARLLAAQRRPVPPYAAGPAAARAGATALIDTSDGLVRDAARIARASGVRLDLDPAALEPAPDLVAPAERLGADARTWVLTGGEDHALLACFPAGTALPPGYRAIGTVVEGSDGPPVLFGGLPWRGGSGWTHWA
ncbi:thiamine-phosphate kinase [Spongisporangium articulatum]|uniref:Thiamine-monophosphate kinase n=1 Tax=Spongisporangium articulatum TaxID=3362603 RepID=A0ABW8AN42_9ACTN